MTLLEWRKFGPGWRARPIKAFLVWHDVVFRKTHNLEELGEQCLGIDPTLREVGEPDTPTEEEAGDALAAAHAVLEAITTRLPSEIDRRSH